MLPEFDALQHFHFLRPAWALLLVPIVLIAALQNRLHSKGEMFDGIIAPHLLEHLRLRKTQWRWFNPRGVSTVVALLLLVVLMGPSWRQQPSPLSQDKAPLVVVLDISRSMEQQDIQPSRLRRAKQKIVDLMALRRDKQTALIVYSGSAHTVLPLTADQDILGQYLAAIEPAIMPRAGKFPEYALPLVDTVLRETSAPASVVLLTDGLGKDSIPAFTDYFQQRSHQLLVVGIGTQNDEDGLIPLERQALQELANNTGGRFILATVDDSDVRQLNRRIDSHYVVIEDSALPWLDSGYPLVFPALALFLLWFRRGWTLTWCWLMVPVLLLHAPAPAIAAENTPTARHWFADLWLTGDQQGRLMMQLGHYDEAARRFQDPMWKAMAYYYAEDFMRAAEYFSRSDSDQSLFNQANARAHARDYVRALHRYDQLLARNPGYPGAAQNRQRVQALVDEINRISESQREEQGVSGEEKSLDGEDAIPAEGADELAWDQTELKQLSADDILQEPATQEMWLRGVQRSPADFLAVKFDMQLRESKLSEQEP